MVQSWFSAARRGQKAAPCAQGARRGGRGAAFAACVVAALPLSALVAALPLSALVAALPLSALVAALPRPAAAETSAKDAQVIVRAIGFQVSKPTGEVKVAVVFDPAQAESVKDAEQARAALEAARGPALTPVPVLVPVGQLSTLDTCQLVFVTLGTAGARDAIFEAARGRKLLTVSTDPSCAQAGKCVMAVKSEPRVEIVVNRAAAQASAVEFTTAFRMMISEI